MPGIQRMVSSRRETKITALPSAEKSTGMSLIEAKVSRRGGALPSAGITKTLSLP